MALTYENRNLENINKLADHTKAAALKWNDFLVKNNIDILINDTTRTEAQQREDVQKGVSQTMKSFHLVGQALDFVLIRNGKADWNGYNTPEVQKAVAEAKRLGFEWGGDWTGFVDPSHLQYNYKGYGTDTFSKGKVASTSVPNSAKALKSKSTTQPKKNNNAAPYPGHVIERGSTGQDVKRIQQAVGATPDGIFGPVTEAKVKAYQKRHGLIADGMVGPKTWSVMF